MARRTKKRSTKKRHHSKRVTRKRIYGGNNRKTMNQVANAREIGAVLAGISSTKANAALASWKRSRGLA